MINEMRGAIFDLDGVIVNTAKYHYLAWKRLAKELGFDFTEADNERLKGVSRMRSLEILLEVGDLTFDEETKAQMAAKKNGWYVEYIDALDAGEILPGAEAYLEIIRARGVKVALGSASKNAPLILDRLGIVSLFDVVVDGNKVSKAKPDPEVFLRAAKELGIPPASCVVFEDAEAGVEAALRGGMGVVGVGNPARLKEADMVIAGLYQLVALEAVMPQFPAVQILDPIIS
ncbi:MAG: beta-phosphoglucomutase [Anaerolineae bacterium]|nr:beta-phosphoglucomutase [Anaerolineae bacterium]